ncbi:hypothetical protein [Rubellimicrobium arenae]|uniref:hypothetical protein n=1 Tax=Rubellimicrobium arenae TaxID=2817372 RepID=UPI001B310C89|nr:hypothetical protein [Rubellimicrobium arenae]
MLDGSQQFLFFEDEQRVDTVLPPYAPLAMPTQILERRRRRWSLGWWRMFILLAR